MPRINLYTRLKSIEDDADRICNAINDFNFHLHESTPNPLGDYERDILEYQRISFSEYKDNFVLQRAISREKSVSETLEDLIETNRSWHQWFPKKRNESLNNEVEATSELIGNIDFLETRWKYAWDNVAMGAIYGGLLAMSASFISSIPFKLKFGSDNPDIIQASAFLYSASAVLGPLFGGWWGSNQRHQKNKHREEARYIDEKIKEIYFTPDFMKK